MAWGGAAVAVPALLAAFPGAGVGPATGTFVVLEMCFLAGAVSNAWLLSRPPLRRGGHLVLPMVRRPDAVEIVAPPRRGTDAKSSNAGGPVPKQTRIAAEFTRFSTTGATLQVTIVTVADQRQPDPAVGDLTGALFAELRQVVPAAVEVGADRYGLGRTAGSDCG
ncbi:hypothetical protein GCM10011581_45700 [Saccharopolyspora subtropica]|uniref:Uncharacterized protein n=1 Tax=Saccharopolyspora thermophila TaxID=89367 RepID=A0A917K743_9PSEU|nr:hypothetical protein [Saccharopolyspora subtropica]GGJ03464.1 hypothetical protein GCM10011581_45700 [Saccharopolyspora subtropica]